MPHQRAGCLPPCRFIAGLPAVGLLPVKLPFTCICARLPRCAYHLPAVTPAHWLRLLPTCGCLQTALPHGCGCLLIASWTRLVPGFTLLRTFLRLPLVHDTARTVTMGCRRAVTLVARIGYALCRTAVCVAVVAQFVADALLDWLLPQLQLPCGYQVCLHAVRCRCRVRLLHLPLVTFVPTRRITAG